MSIVGMGVVFSCLGVLAAKTGQVCVSLLSSPEVVTGLAVFLLLATSMFGAFELGLPSSLQTRLNSVGGVGVVLGAVHRSFKEGAQQFALKGVGVALVVSALIVRGGALDASPTGALWCWPPRAARAAR